MSELRFFWPLTTSFCPFEVPGPRGCLACLEVFLVGTPGWSSGTQRLEAETLPSIPEVGDSPRNRGPIHSNSAEKQRLRWLQEIMLKTQIPALAGRAAQLVRASFHCDKVVSSISGQGT